MNQQNNSQISTKQVLGFFLLILTLFTYFGGLAWISAYWDHSRVDEYRGYEIYFFPEINVYGIEIQGLDVTDWRFNTGIPGCENMIDTWLDDPIHVKDYRDYVIYQQPNDYGFYYAVDSETGEQITTVWHIVDDLLDYIDQVYYPSVVVTWHRVIGDYIVYRQGIDSELRYWIESPDGDLSQFYSTFDDVSNAVNELIRLDEQFAGSNLSDGSETVSGSIEPNVEAPFGEDYEPPDDVVTIGDRIRQRRTLISGIFGVLGVGLIAIDVGERRQ
jgi:hypothetical protein